MAAQEAAVRKRLAALEQETQSLRRLLNGKESKDEKPKRDRNNGNPNAERRTKRSKSDDSDGGNNGRVKWVSGEDDAKSVSRFICGAAMPDAVQSFPVTLHAKNDGNVNTTLKAVAIASKRCAEELETHLACCCSFRDTRAELTVSVLALDTPLPAITDEAIDDDMVLSVARQTDYRVLAGAIAKRAREEQISVLRSIGAASVFTAVRALATTREYLDNNDDDDVDIVAKPRFSKVKFEGRDDETTILEVLVFPSTTSG